MTQAFFDHPFLSGHHQPVRFEATAPGLFEIELEDRALQIAELEVRP